MCFTLIVFHIFVIIVFNKIVFSLFNRYFLPVLFHYNAENIMTTKETTIACGLI